MTDLDMLLQDQATTEGALSLCTIPSRGKVGKMAPEAQAKLIALERRKTAIAEGSLRPQIPQRDRYSVRE